MIYRYNPFFVISWEESLEELQDSHQIENISYGDVGSSLETVYCLMRQQVGVWGEVLLAFFLIATVVLPSELSMKNIEC